MEGEALTLRNRLGRLWRRARAPATVNPRNQRMLQAILVMVGAMAIIAALVLLALPDAAQPWEASNAVLIGGYAWFCFLLARAGRYRLSASLTVAGSLLLIGVGYYQHGLQSQPDLLMIHLLPMLFAGLLLGRSAVWCAAIASGLLLSVGAWSDLRMAASGGVVTDVMSNLLLSGMNFLLLAVILDRLLLSTQRALARSRELQVAYANLKRESGEKEQAYRRLLHTQRLEAIGRLSAGVAHDFNHILSVILGLSSTASHTGHDVALPGIQKAAQRGIVITRRLLSFGRNQDGSVARFDLRLAVEEVRMLIQPMFHPGVRVAFDLSPAELWVKADRDEFELALLNLASNASDAMPGGGRFALSATAEGPQAVIRAVDSGSGMPPDVVQQMFEPFFTTKAKDEGTGIGMTIVHRFVVDSGGTIAVDSEPGRGTRIEIRLPLADTPHAGEAPDR